MSGHRQPGELSRAELVDLVTGLREMMYGGVDDDHAVWDPDQPVSGTELVAWVGEEMARLGLVPDPGPRS